MRSMTRIPMSDLKKMNIHSKVRTVGCTDSWRRTVCLSGVTMAKRYLLWLSESNRRYSLVLVWDPSSANCDSDVRTLAQTLGIRLGLVLLDAAERSQSLDRQLFSILQRRGKVRFGWCNPDSRIASFKREQSIEILTDLWDSIARDQVLSG
jgi:hypothetical protein